MRQAPPIRCTGLSRWYGEVQGLSDLTLEVTPGIVGLLGPNGSGKTTLMRLLTGLIRPTRGRVELFGHRAGPGAWRLFERIGYAPGDDVHFELESGRDFLVLLARLHGESAAGAREAAERALTAVGMTDLAHKRLREMSKGMRQRIKVAQAILHEPELLLLDEPLNGMDPLSRRQVMDLVREHGRRGGTVLFASHILHEVESITDRVILLHHGRLLAEGRLGEIRDLLDRKPRRVTLQGASPQAVRRLAAAALQSELVSGLAFEGEDGLHLDTRSLGPLLEVIQTWGEQGDVQSLSITDENLEAIFDLLVGGNG